MNDSVEAVKKIILANDAAYRAELEMRRAAALRRGEAMRPLIEVLGDLEDQYIRVSVMRLLWPHDYAQRDDRVRSLIQGFVLEEGIKCGIKLKSVGGSETFSTEIIGRDELSFVYAYDSAALQPQTRTFANQRDWMNLFINQMAKVIEPRW
jgi:hypothetical protein